VVFKGFTSLLAKHYQFVNDYRVKYVCEHIKLDNKAKIIELALDVGFLQKVPLMLFSNNLSDLVQPNTAKKYKILK
jgi:hypothetical protein